MTRSLKEDGCVVSGGECVASMGKGSWQVSD